MSQPLTTAPAEPCREHTANESFHPEDLELKLLLEALFLQSGFDLRNYRRPLLKQRILACLESEQVSSISELQAAVLRDGAALDRLLLGLTARQSLPFDEPAFYRTFRQELIPWLRTYPFARLWVAGCAGGAEAYSLAIILLEEGLQDRCRIYATDLSEAVVQHARAAAWPLPAMRTAAANYRKAGGRHSLSDFYQAAAGQARMAAALARNLVFATHNLVTDASFNEFHLILCREAMSEFDPILQGQVHDLLYASLVPRGLLLLGRANALAGATLHHMDYEIRDPRHHIYRKKWSPA